ncbi:hypothetical protein [Amycolatopsis sp. NPDC051372]|uniref:5'-methylthioadenosine/S-adenosylhomocysteine nucleosidase family protein n=1 Tax=Amycolatopsis sp. NPDC051372 TaxID=3155669 RepID=UPI00343B3C0C
MSEEARWIRQHYNDAMAIEMEAAGVAQAGHLSGCPIAIVRGISDLADGAKNSTADWNWQPVAASHAAAFAVCLAEQLIRKGEYRTMNERTTGHRGSVHNYAAGQVGIQAVNAIGNTVHQNSSGPIGGTRDLAAELVVVRADLDRERARGQVDDATYGAACAELDQADVALGTDGPERKDKVVLALKRLGGLVSDLAELTAKVTALIAAAKGLA